MNVGLDGWALTFALVLGTQALSGCAALGGKEVYVVDTAACTLKCLIEQERAKGHQEVVRKLEALDAERKSK